MDKEFTPITINSQEELDNMFKDRVARAEKKFEGYISPEDLAGKLAVKDDEISKLSATLSDLNKEKEEFDNQIAEKDKTIKQYETDSAKTKIANEMGLSYDAVKFLSGEDEDSIRESAKSLSALVKANHTQPEPNYDNPQVDKKTANLKSMLSDLNK